ncbi:hypothetical protein KIPB_014250 [Kipferlia bialata]|uniref:Zinc finger ZPR1-type domain-containing protein n=1 Tax=Kipferlia bialata TaxID=797122 RepID=A0A391NT09_9EUKA|nr:hypothetical protein KIPB_014250 [Kipferlia bialata]|eukprot:g14250.t1
MVLSIDPNKVSVIDSECRACGQAGQMRILPTNIPNFREIILMSFACPHCGHTENDVQEAAELGVGA